MKIALSTLSGLNYGGKTYFKNFLPALAEVDRENEYHIFVPKGSEFVRRINQKNFIFHECPGNARRSYIRHFFEQVVLPIEIIKKHIDILYTAKNMNIWLAPCPTVIAIRNVEPFFYRQFSNDWRLNFFSWLRNVFSWLSIKKAKRIVAVSQFVKEVLIKQGVPQKKIDVIYNGNPFQSHGHAEGSNVAEEKFFLTASKFVAYANQMNLIKAYHLLYQKEPDLPSLFLAGGVLDKKYFQQIVNFITEHGLKDKIRFLGYVPHERLIDYYQHCSGFLYPTKLEACPHILIEAMAAGVPVAASHFPPMPEIGAEAIRYFDPDQPEEIAGCIRALWKDKALCSELIQRSIKRAGHFDWKRTARDLVATFETV